MGSQRDGSAEFAPRQEPVRKAVGGAVVLAVALGPALIDADFWLAVWRHGLAFAFVVVALWRLTVILCARRPAPVRMLSDDALPHYTVIAPLYREAGMVDQLVSALDAIDYPRERLQVIFALEADDDTTQAAIRSRRLPRGFEVVVAPPGVPQTKPRACNVALGHARGELVTIYDAEDRPDPMQLREAAARFASGPPQLGCLQAPLRIRNRRSFLGAQFANEYAAQFELLLPAMARMGLPFPLGGTSNHLRTAALRDAGGWDPFNVTEDAELGFRLAARGWRLGVLAAPTWENAPETSHDWLPQRSRWFKGYLQTLAGQLPSAGTNWRLACGMVVTLGFALGSALVHLPMFTWLLTYAFFWSLGGSPPSLTPLDLFALLGGWGAAVGAGALGAHRAGLPVRLRDALSAPFYWPLLTVAAGQALWRWLLEPHRWDKTEHQPWPVPA